MKSPNTNTSTVADDHLQNQPFNPIKSLLSQLQQQQQQEDLRQPNDVDSNPYSPYQDQSPSPPPLQHQSPQVPPRSIWNNHHHHHQNNPPEVDNSTSSSGVAVRSSNTTKIDQWSSSRNEIEEPNSFYNHVQHQRELGSSSSQNLQHQHQSDNTTNIITGDDLLVDNLVDD